MRRRVQPARKRGTGGRRDLQRQPHIRGAWALPDVHADRALSGGLRDVQSVRVPRPLRRHFTILQPHYVSHTIGSHTSILALLEKRFSLPSLTARDANASDLEDMFDFDSSPSASAAIGTAPLPTQPGDPNCPFAGSPSGAFVDHPPH